MPGEEGPAFAGMSLPARLAAFVRGSAAGDRTLPWASRLSPQDRERLRSDLEVVLSEPEATGEPLDWQEIGDILEEWAEIAGWEGPLVEEPTAPSEESSGGCFSVDLRPRDAKTLACAPAGVQRAMHVLLAEFLPAHPTVGERLPRGQLKKLKNRGFWQIDLSDGYRLRYWVDKPGRVVYILYFGPHPADYRCPPEPSIEARARYHNCE
jgi:mRNA-degrading endonuclease RelE of RelBE toxin-antitoxin system